MGGGTGGYTPPAMRLLLYHNGALGDFVSILPALRALRASFPEARITLLGRPAHGELAAAFSLVDETLDAASAAYATLYTGAAAPEAAALLSRFDLTLLWSASASLVGSFRALRGASFAHPPFPDAPVSAYRYHALFVTGALGAFPGAPRRNPFLEEILRPPLLGARGSSRGNRVVIHPGSGSPAKCWPPERHLELSASLRRKGLTILWSFGPADAEVREILEPHLAPADQLVGEASPVELARRFAGSRLYVGMDSGVSHLAAAVGCPALLLFGPTSEEVWRPPGEHVRVLSRRLSCPLVAEGGCIIPPRGERCGRKAGGVAPCMLSIEPSEVLRAADELLSRPPPWDSIAQR